MSEHEQLQQQQQQKRQEQQQQKQQQQHDEYEQHDDDEVELPFEVTVGVISMIQQDWWLDHPDVLSEAEAICAWEELHVERRTVGPVIDVRPVQRLTLSVEEAAIALGISRTFAYEAVARGEIPCIRIGRRILIPKAALEKLLAGGAPT
jgi:excisionase family DNA binding protein